MSAMSKPSDSLAPPQWAVEHVRASLAIGMGVPEIEKRLVEKGLSAADAREIVTKVLHDWMHERSEPDDEPEGSDWIHRGLSFALAGFCLYMAYAHGGRLSLGRTAIGVLFPLAWVWFPEIITRSADASWLRILGWIVLLAICGYRGVLLLAGSV